MESLAVPRVNPTNFVALALVINRLRDGPTFVFHYPPQVNITQIEPRSFDDDIIGHGDILLERLSGSGSLIGSCEGIDVASRGSQTVPWDHVAGFPTRDLASILTPGRPYHKKLFQLSLDPLYCVSYPIHVPESGKWKKKKRPHRPKSAASDGARLNTGLVCHDDRSGDCGGKNASESADANVRVGEDNPQSEPGAKTSTAIQVDEAEDKPSSMNMFNLVFILNPKKHEVNDLVDTLYFNIVKKVNKALKYSQEHSDFVWKESKRILILKEKGREETRRMTSLWKEIVLASSLATSIQDIYESVSQNKIATFQLETTGGALTQSVQIPIPFVVADLPPEGEDEHHCGLWLTTANTFVEEDAIDEPSFLDKNFALLLTADEKNIISELRADSDPTAQAMVEFVKLSKPTISFYKVGQNAILSLSQVRRFAQHFIFWRRAIAIPPLHARDVYVLSPNCNLSQLPRASIQWQRTFSHVPSLPNFLSDLSHAPRPYKNFAPTKMHRPLYLHMLAWLLRGGWVTQLCTFAYVVVWPELVYEVEYQLEAEELRKAASEEPQATQLAVPASLLSLSDKQGGSDNTHVPTITEQAAEQARLERIADKATREAAEKATAHARKVIPSSTEHPSLNSSPHLMDMSPYIILDSKKSTGRESLYLSAIARRLKDEKAAVAWPRFLKYLNGQCALERIALQEDMKRKDAWALLGVMSEHLLCVRHW